MDPTDRTLLLLAALASAGAGLVHAAASGTHTGDTSLVRLFALTAAVQLGWAAYAVVRQGSRSALLGVALGIVAVAAWGLSRVTGLPVIESLRSVEPLGVQDGVAAALAGISALLAGLAAAGVRTPRTVRRVPVGALGAVALLALAVPGVAASHGHGPSHDHDGGHATSHHGDGRSADDHAGRDGSAHSVDHERHAAADDHRADGGHVDHGHEHEGEPVISLTDPRVDDQQRDAAQQLIDDTVAGMARFDTVESVEEAGYVSIGDGVTGWEHFIHVGHIADGVEMDANAIESVVFKVYPDGTKQLASAMYIMGFGSTMDDVPDIAGELTTWHDHQDLCWEGAQVVGIVDAEGNCSSGRFRSTPPMLHVWLLPHRCGPFAGIEGSHGSGCAHDHGPADADGAPEARETAAGS